MTKQFLDNCLPSACHRDFMTFHFFSLPFRKEYSVYSRLIVLSPSKRLSARQTLSHPWLSPDEKTIELSKWALKIAVDHDIYFFCF